MGAVKRLPQGPPDPDEVGVPGPDREEFEKREVPEDVYLSVLDLSTETLDAAGIPYVLIGGIASAVHGRPRMSLDIDFLVRPHDARGALEVLAAAGFRVQETDPEWLYKAERDGVVVDLLFVSYGGIYLDEEMLSRARLEEFAGRVIRVAAPEDLIVMKSLAHSEATPRYWYDALGIIGRADLDWDYLLRRARMGDRRILSLLFYAESEDLVVPRAAIAELIEMVRADEPKETDGRVH